MPNTIIEPATVYDHYISTRKPLTYVTAEQWRVLLPLCEGVRLSFFKRCLLRGRNLSQSLPKAQINLEAFVLRHSDEIKIKKKMFCQITQNQFFSNFASSFVAF